MRTLTRTTWYCLMLPAWLAACSTPKMPEKQAEENTLLPYESFQQAAYPECRLSSADRYNVLNRNGEALFPLQEAPIYPLGTGNWMYGANAEERKILSGLFLAAKEPLKFDPKAYLNEHCLDVAKLNDNTAKFPLIGLINEKGEWLAEPFWDIKDDKEVLWQKLQQLFPGHFEAFAGVHDSRRQQLERQFASQLQNQNIGVYIPDGFASVLVSDKESGDIIGLADYRSGNWLISPQTMKERHYQNLQEWRSPNRWNKHYLVEIRKNNQTCMTLLDERGGETGVPLFKSYDYVDEKGRILAESCEDGRQGFVDIKQGGWLLRMPVEYRHLVIEGKLDKENWVNVSSVTHDGYFSGMMDLQGRLRLPVRFRALDSFDSTGLADAKDEEGRYGVINRAGEWLLRRNEPFDRLPNSRWLETEVKEGSFSYQTIANGTPVAEPFADKGIELVYGFDDQGYGFARKIDADRRKMLDQEGYVNERGEWLIPPQYSITALSQMWSSARGMTEQDIKEYLKHRPMSKVYLGEATLDNALFDDNGLLIAMQNGKRGVINRQGKVIVPFEYENIDLGGYRGNYYGGSVRNYIYAGNLQGIWVYDYSGKVMVKP